MGTNLFDAYLSSINPIDWEIWTVREENMSKALKA